MNYFRVKKKDDSTQNMPVEKMTEFYKCSFHLKKTNKIPIFAAAILLIVFLVAGGFFFLSSRTSTPKTQTAVNTNNPNLNNPKPLENVINDTTKDTSDQQVDRDLQEVDKSLDEADVNNTEVDEGLNDKQTNLQ